MNNLLLRRRALIGIGGKKMSDNIAVKAIEAPTLLAAFYNAGLCVSPDYMTIGEAGAVTWNDISPLLSSGSIGDVHNDLSCLRYFGNALSGKSNFYVTYYNPTAVVFPNDGVGQAYSKDTDLYVIVNGVPTITANRFRTNQKLVVIFTSTTPPDIQSLQFITNEWSNKLNFVIYCPDTAVPSYKSLFLSLPDQSSVVGTGKSPQQVADRVYAMSDYDLDWDYTKYI